MGREGKRAREMERGRETQEKVRVREVKRRGGREGERRRET